MYNDIEYAIMRALGTPRKAARRALLLSLGVPAAVAIPLGGAAGLYFVLRSVSSDLSDLAAEVTAQYVPDTSLPVGVIVVCFIGQVVFLALITVIFLIRLDKTPPLALLQGETKARKIAKKANREGRTSAAAPTYRGCSPVARN